MTSSLIYTVLPVGQGTGTLVEVIDDTSKIPLAVIIIDLGVTNSDGWIGANTGETSAGIVAEELKKMANPTIDGVFLSHPDADHINMIPYLLEQFAKPDDTAPDKPVLIVKKVWFGGEKGKYKFKNDRILTLLKAYRPVPAPNPPPAPPPDRPTNIVAVAPNAGDPRTPLYNDKGLKICLISGNAPAAKWQGGKQPAKKQKLEGGYAKNTSSLVLVASYGSATQRHIVATADATGLTMSACLVKLKALNPPWLASVLSISLPHHGSALTTYDLLGKKESGKTVEETAQDVVTEFVNIFKPESVTVSAGENGGFKLPSPRVIADFAAHAKEASAHADPLIWGDGTAAPGHFYAAYYTEQVAVVRDATAPPVADTHWPPTVGSWWPARTTKAIYTVDYFTNASDANIETRDIPLVQRAPRDPNNPNAVPPVEARFTSSNGPFTKVAWIHSWAYTISEDGVTVTFGHRADDSTNFAGNPETDDDELDQFTRRLRPLPAELFPPVPPLALPPSALAPVVVRGAARPRTAMLHRPGRRQVRLLP